LKTKMIWAVRNATLDRTAKSAAQPVLEYEDEISR
jgi:hypothetical protein